MLFEPELCRSGTTPWPFPAAGRCGTPGCSRACRPRTRSPSGPRGGRLVAPLLGGLAVLVPGVIVAVQRAALEVRLDAPAPLLVERDARPVLAALRILAPEPPAARRTLAVELRAIGTSDLIGGGGGQAEREDAEDHERATMTRVTLAETIGHRKRGMRYVGGGIRGKRGGRSGRHRATGRAAGARRGAFASRSRAAPPRRPERFDTVVIDAGHGGDRHGARRARPACSRRTSCSRWRATSPRGCASAALARGDDARRGRAACRSSSAPRSRTTRAPICSSRSTRTPRPTSASTASRPSSSRSRRATRARAGVAAAREQRLRARADGAIGALSDPFIAILGDLISTEHLDESSEFAQRVAARARPRAGDVARREAGAVRGAARACRCRRRWSRSASSRTAATRA